MDEHILVGTRGEDLAAKIMADKGYRIVARNWRYSHLEIDLIAENDDEIVFVEVKTRTQLFGGKEPYEAVNNDKQRKLMRAINAYIQINNETKIPRFDIIGIYITAGKVEKVEHLENVYTPLNIREKPNSFHWGRRNNYAKKR